MLYNVFDITSYSDSAPCMVLIFEIFYRIFNFECCGWKKKWLKVVVQSTITAHQKRKPWKSNHWNNPIQPPSLHHKLKNKKPIKVSQDAVLSGCEAPSPTSNATTTTTHYFRSLSLSSTTKQNSNNYSQQKSNQNKSKRSEWEKQRVGANLPHVGIE